MMHKKVILFGGTFDPIHVGHIEVARFALEHIGAEKIIFIPAKRSPLKAFFPLAPDEDRCAMIRLAIYGRHRFEVSDYELKKSRPSYTIETVRHFKDVFGEAQLHWLVGSDAVDELGHWYKIEELIDECTVSVMCRGGFGRPDFERYVDAWGRQRVEKLERNVLETPLIEVSSTEIRRRVGAGEDISGMVCPEVEAYLRKHRLYRE
jgi:nicotinate-nucleotide adenylyltransferase